MNVDNKPVVRCDLNPKESLECYEQAKAELLIPDPTLEEAVAALEEKP
jgi:hypothetical protein